MTGGHSSGLNERTSRANAPIQSLGGKGFHENHSDVIFGAGTDRLGAFGHDHCKPAFGLAGSEKLPNGMCANLLFFGGCGWVHCIPDGCCCFLQGSGESHWIGIIDSGGTALRNCRRTVSYRQSRLSDCKKQRSTDQPGNSRVRSGDLLIRMRLWSIHPKYLDFRALGRKQAFD